MSGRECTFECDECGHRLDSSQLPVWHLYCPKCTGTLRPMAYDGTGPRACKDCGAPVAPRSVHFCVPASLTVFRSELRDELVREVLRDVSGLPPSMPAAEWAVKFDSLRAAMGLTENDMQTELEEYARAMLRDEEERARDAAEDMRFEQLRDERSGW